jgi:hypothetical protein
MFFLLLAVISAVAPLGVSECITVTPDVPKWFKTSEMVFTGTLVTIEAESLTFRADRIWKGKPSQPEILVYVVNSPYIGSYGFRKGERYLIFAHALSADERIMVLLPPHEKGAGVVGIYRPCGTTPWPLSLTTELDKIARGRKP